LMAGSRSGRLQRARAAAARAAILARTPREQFEAAKLLWRIDGDLSHREAELKDAQLLVRLNPQNEVSILALRHAAMSNGLMPPVKHADAALTALGRAHAR
jgi:hypothetical protein